MKAILKQTLDEMTDEFTSNYFCEKLREKGIPLSYTKAGNVSNYLHKTCIQKKYSKRIWLKKHIEKPKIIENKINDIDLQISEAIKLLKNNGYRILKITYQEI